jgi:hypothetical protein
MAASRTIDIIDAVIVDFAHILAFIIISIIF